MGIGRRHPRAMLREGSGTGRTDSAGCACDAGGLSG